MTQPDGPPDDLVMGESSPIAAAALRWMTRLVVAVTAVALVLPGRAGTLVAWGVVLVLIGVPLLRVLWLGIRWARFHDTPFALAAFGLVATVAAGAVVTVLLR